MAEESALAELLCRAGNVFSLAGQLGRAFHEEGLSRASCFDPSVWRRHAPACDEFADAILELREVAQKPPDGFAPVAQVLLKAGHVARDVRKAMQGGDGRGGAGCFNFYPDLNSICDNGGRSIKEVRKERRLDDPFAYLDEPTAMPTYSLLDRFPLTPEGHVAFLEFVRDEVHNAMEAKRLQVPRDYSNQTLESMVLGIKWTEASERLAALSELPADAVKRVGQVLRRELTIGTVEQIDELLTPAVRMLRDGFENSNDQTSPLDNLSPSPTPTKPKRSTERGEGKAKLVAVLTKHHKYADGGCLNLEPIGNNELARLAAVAKRTASAFFDREFQGHAKYRVLCNDPPRLLAAIKALNGEFRPHEFYNARTPDEVEQDDE